MALAVVKPRLGLWLLLIALFATGPTQAAEQASHWLSHTFRIDPSISSVTLLIERENNSTPVVLIRPDGSKYYHQQHPDNIKWASTPTRDTITLWQPEPGPWQATGKINNQRGITLVSPFELKVNELPPQLYQQEMLKLSAELRHGQTRLDSQYYLQDLSLQAQLLDESVDYSGNFAPAPKVIGEYLDDGQGLDEYPNDGKLTAAVVLDALPGNYVFQTQISNEVLARTKEQKIQIEPMPLSVSFSEPDEGGQWRLELGVAEELLADSLIITGQLTTPDQERINISGSGAHIVLPNAELPGNYYWQGQAFVNTKEGREVTLNLPKKVVRISPPPYPEAIIDPTPASSTPWATILTIVGLLLLLVSGGVIYKRKVDKRKQGANEQG